MLTRLLPRALDNIYRGHNAGLWLFTILVAVKLVMGLNSALNPYFVASSADGIPLDAFTPAARQTVASLFATVGLSQVVLGLLGLLVLLRYRGAIALMFTLLLLEHLGRQLLHQIVPAATSAAPAFAINAILFTLETVGLALALTRRVPTLVESSS